MPTVNQPSSVTNTGAYRFSLSSLMLLITLASVLMGVLTLVPPLGVLLGLLSFVAVYRTAAEVKIRAQQGHTIGPARKCEWFLHHFIVATFMGMTALITFMLVGAAGCIFSTLALEIPDWEWLMLLGMIISLIVASVVSIYVTIQIWKTTGRGWL